MDTLSVTSSCTHSGRVRTQSLDSGVYVRMNFEDSLPSSEVEEADEDKQKTQHDRGVKLQPEEQNHNEESPDKLEEQLENDSVKSPLDPDTDGLKVSTSAVMLPDPPPLPPKCFKKSPAFEKTSQGPGLKVLLEEDESVSSYHSPSLGGRGSNVTTEEIPVHNDCTLEIVPETDSSPSRSPKPPEKPPRRNKLIRAETEEGQTWTQDAEKRESERISPQPPPKPKKSPAQPHRPLRDGAEAPKERTARGSEQWRDDDASVAELISPNKPEAGEMLSVVPELPETQSQLPAAEPQDEADGQTSPGPGPLDVTEELKTNVGSTQLEDAQETGEAAEERHLKQSNQKASAGRRLKKFARKVVCKFKEGREEKRRSKTGEVAPAAVTEDETGRWEDEGREEAEECMDESSVSPSARIHRRHGACENPFGSFKVYSPIKLMEDLLSNEEWSQFLNASTESPPPQTQPENTARLSDSLQSSSSPEVVLTPDELRGSCVAPEKESAYEDVDTSAFSTEETDRAASSRTLAEQSDLSLRASDIYETVELMQPVVHRRTCLITAKSHSVLDSSVQKYLIKLNKRRKKRHRSKRHRPTSSSQIFTTSIFYQVPAAGEEEQLSTVTLTGNSP